MNYDEQSAGPVRAQVDRDLDRYTRTLRQDPKVLSMKQFRQHGSTSTYDHVMRVARLSLAMDKHLHVGSDEQVLARAAVLHDYYLYDWHIYKKNWNRQMSSESERLRNLFHKHGFTHPEVAMENADRDFSLNEKERNIIRSHMWPLTFFHVPRSREAVLVCIADKICTVGEAFHRRTTVKPAT